MDEANLMSIGYYLQNNDVTICCQDFETVCENIGENDFVYFDSFEEYREKYAERAFYPFMLQAEKSLRDVKPESVFSLVFGNEATGLPEKFLDIGTSVIIPHSDRIDSLNLPIAASIAMWELTTLL